MTLLGGMSWTSTAEYYRQLNKIYAERRGACIPRRCCCIQ